MQESYTQVNSIPNDVGRMLELKKSISELEFDVRKTSPLFVKENGMTSIFHPPILFLIHSK